MLMKGVEAAIAMRRRWQSNPYGLLGMLLLTGGAFLAVFWSYQLLEQRFDPITATALISLILIAAGVFLLYWSHRLKARQAVHNVGGQLFAEVKNAAVQLDLPHLIEKGPGITLMGAIVVGLVLGLLTSSKRR